MPFILARAPRTVRVARGGSHFSHSSVMPALSSARSSLALLVLLLAMRHGQSLIPQSKHASRVFSASSGPGAQQTCRTTPNSRRPATAAPPVTGSRMGKGEVMSTSAATADGNAAEDVRQVCVKIRNTACFSSTRGIPRPALLPALRCLMYSYTGNIRSQVSRRLKFRNSTVRSVLQSDELLVMV